jgi:hypothetical protein
MPLAEYATTAIGHPDAECTAIFETESKRPVNAPLELFGRFHIEHAFDPEHPRNGKPGRRHSLKSPDVIPNCEKDLVVAN